MGVERRPGPEGRNKPSTPDRCLRDKLDELKLTYRVVWKPGRGEDVRERVEAVKRWFLNDWQTLDNKIKSSIVEGVSVFLSMFDMPDVAKVFCPGPPEEPDDPQAISVQARGQPRSRMAGKETSHRPRRSRRSKRNESRGRDICPHSMN